MITTVLLLAAINETGLAQQSTNEYITIGGIVRNYKLYIPNGYENATSPVPLVVNIHGKTSSASDQESYTGFKTQANLDNFIVVYPNSTIMQGVSQWNVNNSENSSQDVQFISELIDYMIANYNINSNRVYVMGFSNGGLMTSRLACEVSEKIAAIGTVEGGMNYNILNSCDPQHPMPYMNIHGTIDAPVPYYGNTTMVPATEVVDYWKNFNGISGNTITTKIPNTNLNDESSAQRIVYNDVSNKYRVTHIKIDGGGHSWAGSNTIIDVTNQDFSASEALWKFVKRYSLNNLIAGIEPADDDDLTAKELSMEQRIDSNKENDILITPNPFISELNINSTGNTESSNIAVHNMLGQKVNLGNNVINQNSISVNTSDWKSGIYFLSYTNAEGKISTQKIIKR